LAKNKPIHKGWFVGSAVVGLGVVYLVIKLITGGGITSYDSTQTPAPVTSAAIVTELSPPPTVTAATPIPTQAPVDISGKITLWYVESEDQEELAFNNLIDRMEEAFPRLTLFVQVLPLNDFDSRYSSQVKAGLGPDLVLNGVFSVQDPSIEEFYADVSALVKGRLDAYLSDPINQLTSSGKIYGLPQSIRTVEFWYNKDMLSEPPATTDELISIMQWGSPVSISVNNCYNNYGFYGAFDGQIFDVDGQVIADQSVGVVKAIEYLYDLNAVAKTNGWPVDESNFIESFKSGNAAALINGNWLISDYRTHLGDKLAVAALPAGPGGPATPFYGVQAFLFNPNSENLDVAVEVAYYLTSQESLAYMMNEANLIPARADVEITDPLLKDLVKAINTGYTIPLWTGVQSQAFWANFCGLDQVFDQGMNPEEWVKTAAENARNQ
jgi:arabinogalactan oligomer/maltooligosaccharide transport system substrate-binding protein